MKPTLTVILILSVVIIPTTFALDFSKYKTCQECTKAGFGWCPIRRICGGFANQECGEGERYWREDYTPPGQEKQQQQQSKKEEEEEKPKAASSGKFKALRKFPGVVTLTGDNFTRAVIESDEPWLVEFYAPWCGHCKALAPEWEKAAKALKGIVRLGAVDADTHRSLGSQFGVEGFPTIKYFGENKKSPKDYDGGRKAADIVDYSLKAVRSIVDARLATAGIKLPNEQKEEPPKKEEKKEEPKKEEKKE
eukprot:PhF_6_TR38834/c1_g1_i2/m.58075/K09584/PDIA6, TXNDC7; protein disulfide-isomerase A6